MLKHALLLLILFLFCAVFQAPSALGQDEFADVVLADTPLAYFRFEEAAGAEVAVDSSGNGNDSLELANITFGEAGIVGNAAYFPGTDCYLMTGLTMNPNNSDGDETRREAEDDFSIEVLIKSEVSLTNRVIASQQDGTFTKGRSNLLYAANTGRFGSYIGGRTTASDVKPDPQRWYHVIMTYEGVGGIGSLRFYVDGVFAGTNGVNRTAENADGSWILGAHKNLGQSFFRGHIDEIVFYGYRLDDPDGDGDMVDSRVSAHYDTLPQIPCGSLNVLGSFTDAGTLKLDIATSPDECDCALLDISLDGEVIETIDFPADGVAEIALPDPCEPGSSHTVTVMCSPDGASGTCSFRCPGAEDYYTDIIMADAPVAYYKFEEDDATQVMDSSGNDHHSVNTTNATTGVAGYVGNALLLQGDGNVELGFQMNPADSEGDGADLGLNDLSIEFFVNPSAPSNSQIFFAQQDGVSEDETITPIGRSILLITNNNKLGAYLGAATTNSTVTPEANTWYHMVMTYDGGTGGVESIKLYVDGEFAGTNSGVRIAEHAFGNWIIGAHKNVDMNFFKGFIDDVSIYDYRIDDPDGDDDTQDSVVPIHYYAAAEGSVPPCATLNLACSVNEETDLIEVTLAPGPLGSICESVELLVDDVAVQTVTFPLEGPVTVALPEDCASGSLHVLTAVLTATGLTETCEFTCPANPCTALGLACEVTEADALSVTLALDPADCDCDSIELSIDDVLVETLTAPIPAAVTLALPADCASGSAHVLTAVLTGTDLAETCDFSCPENACTALGLACEVTEDGALSVTLALDPADCDCDSIELSIDDVLVETLTAPIPAAVTLALPADCQAGSEHTLKAVNTTSGLTETCSFLCPGTQFKRGDVNADGQIDLSDPIYTLTYLFVEGPDPVCMDAADANDDESIDLSDAIAILTYQFTDSTPLADPFDACGADPSGENEGDLDCAEFVPCD